MRILFVCNTLYQIIGACCIRKMFPEAEAELILSDHSTASKKICEEFRSTGLIFDKVYYVETKYLYEFDKKISKWERCRILKDKNTVLGMVNLADTYDKFFCANSEPFTQRVANYVKQTNPAAELNWFEDGLSAYFFDRCYFPSFKGRAKSFFLRALLHVYWLTACMDNYYVFNPDKMEWNPPAKVQRIAPISSELAAELGKLFNVAACPDKYEEKYIFFEDGFQDLEKSADIALVNQIADKVGKENIFVRIHPRNPVNRFKELGYKTNQDTSIPWEILAVNMDMKDKVLMTMYSQSIMTPDILMGVKAKAVSLALLDPFFKEYNLDVYDFMKRKYFDMDKEHYFTPKNMDEFDETIEKLEE